MPTINDLFAVAYGNKLDMNKMGGADKATGIAFVGRKGGLSGHSGVSGYVNAVDGESTHPAGTITVALGGSRLLSSYVQQRPYYTAQNVAVLHPETPICLSTSGSTMPCAFDTTPFATRPLDGRRTVRWEPFSSLTQSQPG